jgi:hypothetical protein
VSGFDGVRRIVPRKVWEGITARAVHGERLTLAVVELEPLHGAESGPDGATVLDLFAPPRSEWQAAEAGEPGPGRWPE